MCSSYVWRSLGLRELEDRKAWLRRNPEIPGESLRIIARGFERFDKSGKRFELLVLDKQSTTVVTEHKGGQDVLLRISRPLVARPSLRLLIGNRHAN